MVAERRVHRVFALPDRSYQGLVRRDITRLAETWQFDDVTIGRLNIIVAEMTSNLVKHTPQGGELLVAALGDGPVPDALEVLCLDSGPGMRDPARMLLDGTSTYGSRGEGLGAIRRQAHTFDIYSWPGVGTAILTRLYRAAPPTSPPPYGGVLVPKPGEQACGDGWAVRHTPAGLLLLATDGLGHGPQAEHASLVAAEAFQQLPDTSPTEVLRRLHQRLRGTRGAVGGVALLDPARQSLRYCGVGNVAGRLLGSAASRSLISYNGIVGHTLPASLHDAVVPVPPHNLMVLASDGLKTRWDWARYPGLLRRDPTLIAAVLYHDQTRRTDDSMVLVVPLA